MTAPDPGDRHTRRRRRPPRYDLPRARRPRLPARPRPLGRPRPAAASPRPAATPASAPPAPRSRAPPGGPPAGPAPRPGASRPPARRRRLDAPPECRAPALDARRLVLGVILVVRRRRSCSSARLDRHQPRRASTWPLWIVVPGVAMLVGSFALPQRGGSGSRSRARSSRSSALILWVQETYDAYSTWAYAWALVAPTAPGLGMLLYGARPARRRAGRATGCGRRLVGLGLFLGFALFFEGVDRPVRRRRSRTLDEVLPYRRSSGSACCSSSLSRRRPPRQGRPPQATAAVRRSRAPRTGSAPPGVMIVTASPTLRPISAAPTGDDARDAALARVRLGRRDDLQHRLLAVLLDPDPRAEPHDRAALGRRDDDRDLELRLERLDPRLEEPLLLARGVVLGVLLEVAVLAGRRDPPDDLRPLGDQLVELRLEPREALGRELDRLAAALRGEPWAA